MSERADTKTILITGANKGIGYETARVLARAGHNVLLGARDAGRGRAAVASLAADGLRVRYVPLDVTDEATVAAAAATVDADYGSLDILINNAAVARDAGRAPVDVSVTDLRGVYETNVIGPVAMINNLVPLLRKGNRPLIGNVSSGLGTVAFLTEPDPELAPYRSLLTYNTSKAALNAITMIYAEALRSDGIRVNALSPGYVATDLNEHTGWDTVAEGGARIAAQVLIDDELTGVFRRETGGVYPW